MHHQAQKGFHEIFYGITQHQKGYIVSVTHKRKILSSYDVIFDDECFSALAYTSQQHSEAMDIRPTVLYIPYVTYLKDQTGDIITFHTV